jgi:hypothetical protein
MNTVTNLCVPKNAESLTSRGPVSLSRTLLHGVCYAFYRFLCRSKTERA